MSSRRILFDVYKTHSLLLVVALFLGNCCYAQTSPNCERPSPSCGNIHNISNPFRLKGDPENCGNKKYELECDHNRLVLYLSSSVKYYVHSINYNNYTIRLVDVGLQQGNCSSLPLYSLSDLNFTDEYQPYALEFPNGPGFSLVRYNFYSHHPIPWDVAVVLWVDCEKPIKSRFYTESNTSASSCIDKATSSSSSLSSGEKRSYSYFLFGSLKLSDVADQCKIDEIRITTLWLPADQSQANISFSDFHSKLEYGFELSWLSSPCEQCNGLGDHYCDIGLNYSVNCYKFCDYWSGPQNRTFGCRLEIFYQKYFIPGYKVRGFDVTGWIILGRTSCGMLCLWAFLIYKFRRRHLSMFDTVEDFLQGQNNLMPIRYSYSEIKKMSRGFKDKLGEGGYGSVYKGKLRSGYVAAIKILGKPKSNGQEFINEVATIGRIHHVNVVRLIGFCATRSKRALFYELIHA